MIRYVLILLDKLPVRHPIDKTVFLLIIYIAIVAAIVTRGMKKDK